MQPRRASALALGFSLAGVVLVVLLVGVAAGVGPSGLTHGRAHDHLFHAPSPSAAPTSSGGPVGTAPPLQLPQGQSDLPFASTIGLILRIALVAWWCWLLVRGLLWLREELQARRHRETPTPEIDFDVLDDPEPVVEEMRRDADEQLQLLMGGEPRNAIVACWERFEEQAERAGLARRVWETSSEFTLRLLEVVTADPAAVSQLSALYREARFSDHVITEDDRQQALAALDRIQETVGGVRRAAR